MRKLFLSLLVCLGCDDRAEGLRELNEPPSIRLQAERGGEFTKTLLDSAKVSNPTFAYMPFVIEISDPNENIKYVRYQVIAGSGYLVFRGERVSGDTVAVVDNKAIYRFVPGAVGTIQVRFVVTDYFDKMDSAVLQLHAFSNLAPVAMLQTSYIGAADKYEYLLDAGNSFDPDHSFGGGLHKYIFSVGTVRIAETLRPAIYFIFPGQGTYSIRLQVQDNDGALSKEVTQTITVN